jgi:hypothetical protein
MRVRRRAQRDDPGVALGKLREEAGQSRRSPDEHQEETSGEGIEGAGVADPANACDAPHRGDHVVRGRAFGLVDEEQSIGAQDCSSCLSLSRMASMRAA